jgi:hypothetical protein
MCLSNLRCLRWSQLEEDVDDDEDDDEGVDFLLFLGDILKRLNVILAGRKRK